MGALAAAISVGAATPDLAAQDAGPAPLRLTLSEAVRRALEANPSVRAAALDGAAAEVARALTRATLLPSVGLRAGRDVTRLNAETMFGTALATPTIGPFSTMAAVGVVSVPIVDVAAVRAHAITRQQAVAARAGERVVREANVLAAAGAYLDLLEALATREAARERLRLAQALRDLASDLQRRGSGTGLDALRADVQWHAERQALIEADADARVATLRLANVLNLPQGRPIECSDAEIFFAPVTLAPSPATSLRPELLVAWTNVDIARLGVRRALDLRLPRVSVTGTAGAAALQSNPWLGTYQVVASVQMPLFTGGELRAREALARIGRERAEVIAEEVQNAVSLEEAAAAARLAAAEARAPLADDAARLAAAEVEQARDRFAAGVAGNVEVIAAQTALARAQANRIAAYASVRRARLWLAHARGRAELEYVSASVADRR
ncbi:hypothetical protein TBR22_A42710 [Luteitalea sp. TBR-22]|nr:hypothetical protein TBR22_A42710 [Luteitalea sp. TBR-22]